MLLRALKDHDNPDLTDLHVAIDPKTLLLTRHSRGPRLIRLRGLVDNFRVPDCSGLEYGELFSVLAFQRVGFRPRESEFLRMPTISELSMLEIVPSAAATA